MIVSFLFILTMLNRYVCKYTIYMYNIYTIYSIVYKKKKEESKEERRNIEAFLRPIFFFFSHYNQ